MMADFNDPDDAEVCRVCRTEAEPDNPLYHPCKCSGSIRYVHSECLVQWLGHSNKKNCELCGHAFSFKKVYPADMPEKLPIPVLAVRFSKDAVRTIIYCGWVIVVATAWLVVLPLIVKGVWGGLFSGGSSMVDKVVGDGHNSTVAAAFNRTATSEDLKSIQDFMSTKQIDENDLAQEVAERMSKSTPPPVPRKVSWADGLWAVRTIFFTDPAVRNVILKVFGIRIQNYIRDTLLSSVFQGQILSVVIVICFLGAFLVREWVVQNGPIDNPAADAPEMGGPARAEDFRPQMAVRWRQRPRGLGDVPLGQLEPDELDRLVRRVQRGIQAAEGAGEIPNDGDARRNPNGGTPHDSPHEEDEEWVDEPDDHASMMTLLEREQGAAFPRDEHYDSEAEVDDTFPMDVDQPDSPNLDTMREARNRYFAVADHNRHFADQAPEVPSSGNESASNDQNKLRQTYRSDFTFEFNVDDVDGDAQGGPSRGRPTPDALVSAGAEGPSIWDPADIALPPSRPDSSLRLDQDQPAPAQPIFPPRNEIAPRRQGGEPARRGRRPRAAGRRPHPDDDEVIQQGMEERWANVDEDEIEAEGFILEGDIEGAMEVMGLRGPPVVLLQNTFIVVLVLTAALTVFVHVPYVLGRMHLVGDISMLGLPVRGFLGLIKLATIFTDFTIYYLAKLLDYMLVDPLKVVMGWSTKEGLAASSQASNITVATSVEAHRQLMNQALAFLQAVTPRFLSLRVEQMFRWVELGFATLGSAYLKNKQYLHDIAAGDSTSARLLCVATGYFDAFCTVSFFSALGEGGLGRFGKAVAEASASHGTVIKLGFFMLIELAAFPMSMGYIVDLCALPLFPTGTLYKRLLIQQAHPLLSCFAHWLCGTLFMFAFAKFLSSCRGVCRRGAMYMIRDPQDPSFSPVRDILDKSTFLQLQKLMISALMYIAVLVGPVGGLLLAVRCLPDSFKVLPLRWYYKEALSTVPGDFIAMLFFMPYYWRRIHAGVALRFLLNKYWRALAKTLRLSSYFYGVRYEAEEVQGPIERRLLEAHKLWTKVKRAVTRSRAPLPNYNDMQMRVPYADSVALVKPRRNVFVEVDDSGVPVSDEGKITAVLQDRVGRKAHRRVKEDYTQVYMPALYPLRFWIFGMSLWISIAWTCALAMFTPIAVGRMVTALYFGRQVHDGYSFFAGLFVLDTIRTSFYKVRKLLGYSRESPSVLEKLRAAQTIPEQEMSLAQTVLRYIKGTGLLVLVPFAIGLLLELYVLFPLKYGMSDMTPVFYAAESWTFGFLVTSIMYHRTDIRKKLIISLASIYNEADLAKEDASAWLQTARINRYSLRPVWLVLLKAVGAAVGGPALVCLGLSVGLRLSERRSALLFRFIYPAILSTYLSHRAAKLIGHYLHRWSVRALEKVYLVEKRVMNIEEAVEPGMEMTVKDPELHAADAFAGVEGRDGEGR